MKLTQEQRDLVFSQISAFAGNTLGCGCGEMDDIAENILDEVVNDIEETADWSDLESDEVFDGDIIIAIGRVITKHLNKKKKVIVLTSEWSIDYESDYLVKVFDADKMDLAKEEMKMDFENFKKEWFYWDEFTIDDRCATASVQGEYNCNHCTWNIREMEVITK
jgi:hypothetical protein